MRTWNFLERKVGGFYHFTSGKSREPLYHNRFPSMGQVSLSLTRQFSLQELPFYSVKLFPQRMDMATLDDGHTLVKCNISRFSGSLHQ